MKPFFIDILSRRAEKTFEILRIGFDIAAVKIIHKLGYYYIEEVSSDYREILRARYGEVYGYRSLSHCEEYCSPIYRRYTLGICRHGNSTKVLKNITYRGKTYYK